MFKILFTTTFFIGFVMLLRCFCKNHISARLQYALWILVAVKLLVFPMPSVEGYFSILSLVANGMDRAVSEERFTGEDLAASETNGQASESLQGEVAANGNLWGTDGQTGEGMLVNGTDSGTEPEFVNVGENGFSKWKRRQQILKLRLQNYVENVWKAPVWVALAWGTGSLICTLLMAIYHLRLRSYLRKNRVELENGRLFSEERAGSGKNLLAVYSIEGLPTPCLFGKSVYIPARLAEDDELLPYILKHEMCHYFHGDSVWGLVRIVCVCLYWFHPLVWLAAYLSRQDCELACDEAVVRRMTGTGRKRYGELLLEFALVKSSPADCFSMTTAMSGNGKNLRERLWRITGRKKNRLVLGITAVLLGLAGIFACITSGFVSTDRQWQSIEIREQGDSIPTQGSYEISYRLSKDAVSYGLYIEKYEYGELVSAEVLDCAYLLPEGEPERKVKRGGAVFARTLEAEPSTGAYVKAAVSYSMQDYAASDGASAVFKAFTLELPEDCIGNSFSFSSAERVNHRFRMNEDIVLLADYYGDTSGLRVPGGHIFDAEEYMEKKDEVLNDDKCVILTHLMISDKNPRDLEKQMEGIIKSKRNSAIEEKQDSGKDASHPEEAAGAEGVNGYSNEELIELSRNYYRQEHGFAPEHVEIDSENGNEVIIWLYDRDEFLNTDNEITGSAHTGDWYTVDRTTGRGENVLFEEIDLTRAGFISASWDKSPDDMEVVDVREQEDFFALPAEPEAGAENRIFLLGETAGYRLYGAGDYRSMILEEAGTYTEIFVPFITDGITMQAPEIQEADYDGDGEAELAVRLLWGEGTGVWEENLWMLDKAAGRIKPYEYPNGALAGELLRQLSWVKEDGKKRILLDGQQISPILQDEGGVSFEELGINTSRVSYAFQDGKIKVRTLISCGSREGSVMPAYGDGCLEAEVLYRGGGQFSLRKTESADLKDMAKTALEAVREFFVPVQIGMITSDFNMETWSLSDETGERIMMTLTIQEEGEDSYDFAEVQLIRDVDGRWIADEDIMVEK